MSSAPPSVPVFRLVSEPSGPRFLGLTVAERNVRVAERAAGGNLREVAAFADDDGRTPVLIVPAGVAITRTFIASISAFKDSAASALFA